MRRSPHPRRSTSSADHRRRSSPAAWAAPKAAASGRRRSSTSPPPRRPAQAKASRAAAAVLLRIVSPVSPVSRNAAKTSCGYSCVSSISAARGAIFSFAMRRAVSWISRCSSESSNSTKPRICACAAYEEGNRGRTKNQEPRPTNFEHRTLPCQQGAGLDRGAFLGLDSGSGGRPERLLMRRHEANVFEQAASIAVDRRPQRDDIAAGLPRVGDRAREQRRCTPRPRCARTVATA